VFLQAGMIIKFTWPLYCLSRDRGDCSARRQKCRLKKNHPKDILCDKNHLYRIVLIHLTSNDVFKTRKHFQMAGYWILKNCKYSKFRLTASLPAHIRKPRAHTKIVQPQFYSTSPVRCAFWDSDECGASVPHYCFYLPLGSSSSSSKTILMY